MKTRTAEILLGLLLTGCGIVMASSALVGHPLIQQDSAAPDNTKANKDDSKTATADNASNRYSDRELMRHIRQDVVKDKNLSSYAHNVKIIARAGTVTLRGPVNSEEEKQTIEKYAHRYVGEGHIVNELAVKM